MFIIYIKIVTFLSLTKFKKNYGFATNIDSSYRLITYYTCYSQLSGIGCIPYNLH